MPPSQPLKIGLWRCRLSYMDVAKTARAFTTSSSTRQIGPESPRYIDVPQPPQQTFPPRPRIKGILPVPRDIFHHRIGGVDKVTPEYLASATQESKTQSIAMSEADETRNQWRLRMASRRRQNLREGLLELQSRRRHTDKFLADRGARRQAQRQQLIEQKEQEDERLTNPSISPVMRLSRTGRIVPDPNREERLAEMVKRVREKEAKRANARQDAMHTLYTHAKDFITTEAQLDSAIVAAFENPSWGHKGSSAWANGAPETVQQMLNRANRTRTGLFGDEGQGQKVMTNRVKRIAEELTGGKL